MEHRAIVLNPNGGDSDHHQHRTEGKDKCSPRRETLPVDVLGHFIVTVAMPAWNLDPPAVPSLRMTMLAQATPLGS